MHPVGMGRYDAPAMYILLRSVCSSSEANHESCSSDTLLHAQQRKCKESDTLLYTASRAACRGLASAGHVRRRALLNRQRTGRGAYVDSSPFYVHKAAEGILSCLRSSASCSSLLSSSRTFGCSRPVLLANSIVALTASMSAFHRSIGPSMLSPPSCLLEYPPNAYDSSPNRCPCCCRSFARCCLHRLHAKRKCAIDSMLPQSHAAVSDALILYRYSLRNVLPVRSCLSMAASVLFSRRY